MHNIANLLVDYWPEYYKTAGYLLNYISTKQLNWKILFEIIDNAKPDLSYMHVYGAKTYVLKNKISCKDWFKSCIYINFLINYDLYNIYCIWFSSSKHVMCTRDITFIKNKFYKPNKLDLRFMEDVEKIMKYFEILLFRPVFEQEELDFDKKILSYIYNQLYIIIG